MASSELGSFVDTELTSLSINTEAEVKDFRIPGERRSNLASPTVGNMATVLGNVSTSRGIYFTSRRRVRSDALRLLREGAL